MRKLKVLNRRPQMKTTTRKSKRLICIRTEKTKMKMIHRTVRKVELDARVI